MTMATASAPNASTHPHASSAADNYDPTDVGPRDSPPPPIHHPKLEPTPSPPGIASEVSTPPGSPGAPHKPGRKVLRPVPNPGDVALLDSMAGGRAREIAETAGRELIQAPDEEEGDEDMRAGSEGERGVEVPMEGMGREVDLEALAAGALRAFNAGEAPVGKQSHVEEVGGQQVDDQMRHMSPKASTINGNHDELPPIQEASPKAEKLTNVTLPSISSQLANLGELKHLADAAITAAVDTAPPNGHRHSISSQSPPQPPLFRVGDPAHHHPAPNVHTSPPPISPRESFHTIPSPGFPAPPLFFRRQSQVSDSAPYTSGGDFTGNVADTSTTDHSGATANGIPAGIDRMSIDGITNPLVGGFQCNYPGCTAQPFQTQYLLNSHANVHSQNRPHYCPVKGCLRSEGGKGFKRKNEMIRHGLVHESPGYVCPYCMDREHKYPRPDNLQRHVRVHHVDKDKDDPLLREVLAQRPEGPSRGRRRRGGNN
ncbi:hypothetical protein VE01_00933 [Pseudogymnoascus verrucosus]|uniref:C2H2-type domain-containing protein n=1 Tax=Pseudogymnoascus verrucosus TaxID=342668 RepID=A0A2P2SW01_9PEZI|nr:uncharacterized protein VE01_00933 [Pseudogymnoascus verrucosus]OBU01021.2 hypothetical protein VE01_00933 [Pseudogymnoascus verrucosus]